MNAASAAWRVCCRYDGSAGRRDDDGAHPLPGLRGEVSKFSDAYDLWHAIQASAADVFVTRDDRFFGHLTRIPGVTGLRVVKSLPEVGVWEIRGAPEIRGCRMAAGCGLRGPRASCLPAEAE